MPSFRTCAIALTFALSAAPAHAADSWGAIAVDAAQSTAEPSYGVGGGDSEEEASGNALNFCHESGGKSGCKVMVTYQQCGAFASNGGDAGWSKASTEKEVQINALQACGKNNCKVVTSDCN